MFTPQDECASILLGHPVPGRRSEFHANLVEAARSVLDAQAHPRVIPDLESTGGFDPHADPDAQADGASPV